MSSVIQFVGLSQAVLFIFLALTAVALEVVSARIAYETLGAVASTLYAMAIGLNVAFWVIAIRSRRAAIAGIVLLVLVIVPYQFVLAERLWRVQKEATRIMAFAYETRLSNSAFPTTLADYTFHDPTTRPFVREYRLDAAAGGFILCYSVGMESTSHCYSPQDGWTYYPD